MNAAERSLKRTKRVSTRFGNMRVISNVDRNKFTLLRPEVSTYQMFAVTTITGSLLPTSFFELLW